MWVQVKTEEKEKRAKEIVKIIKDYGGVISSSSILQLCDNSFTTNSNTLKNFLNTYVLPNYPDVKSIPRRGYIWDPAKKEDQFKNAEGYLDPTAGKAIANMMMSSSSSKDDEAINQIPGEVWYLDPGAYKGNKKFLALVIGGSKGCVNYIPVRDADLDKAYFYAGYCIPFVSMGRNYFVDIRQIRTSGQNSFDRYSFVMDDDIFEKVKYGVAKRFKIETRVETKTVEVVKEIPIYETKEIPAQIDEEAAIKFLEDSGWLKEHDKNLRMYVYPELAEYKAKAESWEQAFRLMCGKELS